MASKTPEAKLLDAELRWLKAQRAAGHRVWWLKIHGSQFQRAGTPDLIVIWHGVTAWIENKAGSNEPSKIQRHVMAQIEAAGGDVYVVRTLDEFKDAVRGQE